MKKYLLIIGLVFLILAIAQNAVALPWVFIGTTGNEPVSMMLLGTLLIALGGVGRKKFK